MDTDYRRSISNLWGFKRGVKPQIGHNDFPASKDAALGYFSYFMGSALGSSVFVSVRITTSLTQHRLLALWQTFCVWNPYSELLTTCL